MFIAEKIEFINNNPMWVSVVLFALYLFLYLSTILEKHPGFTVRSKSVIFAVPIVPAAGLALWGVPWLQVAVISLAAVGFLFFMYFKQVEEDL